MRAATVGVVLSTLLLTTACGGDDKPDEAAQPGPEPSVSAQPGPGDGTCLYSPTATDVGGKKPKLPPTKPSTKTSWATITTNHGVIVMELDAKAAPCTVNSFVSLAKQKFYDNSECHRMLDETFNNRTTAVLQCGDPSGTGRGGPGYAFADENLEGATYSKGVVAMANAGANTNGSQFFMMFKNSDFNPDYTPFGKILSGVDVLLKIAKGGRVPNKNNGMRDAPKTKTVIKTVRISATKPKV
jgi:peptidyl-prolyl cis-trans isomerase B (cyclophilin B)